MGYIERRNGKYRARYRDPLGRAHSKTFTRKADAERFVREMETEKERGNWIDPREADQPLAQWAEEFLLLCRRLAPKSQETYRRDLDRYVLPAVRRLPARPPPGRRDRELAQRRTRGRPGALSVHRHYRILRRMLAVAVRSRSSCEPVRPGRPAAGAEAGHGVPRLGSGDALAEAHNERFRALIYLAVDSGMRWGELVGLRRGRVDLRRGKVRVTEQLDAARGPPWIRQPPKTTAGVRSITMSAFTPRSCATTSSGSLGRARRAGVPERCRQPAVVVELPEPPLRPALQRGRPVVPVPRPAGAPRGAM